VEINNRYRATRIAIFNHKGGVGKTTLTVNIAAALADAGKSVLLVDSDPQCNLTAYLVQEDVVDSLLDNSDSDEGGTLWSALKPIAEATGGVRTITPIERLPNVYLIPGDIRMSEFEEELVLLWNDCYQRKPKGLRGTTALSSLVNKIAAEFEIDYVFYDAGPNIGPLNRIILLDSDYLIVPAACDLFSIRALKTLGHTLANWITEWQTVVELAPDDVYLLPGMPKFLGYIPQRFRVYGGQPSSDYARYLPRIERQIQSDIVTVLQRVDPSLISSAAQLGQIKDFASLAAASQGSGQPLKDTLTGTQQQRDDARETFAAVARKIIERTERP
jgi:cellulose biosynthesis protein BcsQ